MGNRSSVIVGRDAELSAIDAALSSARAGRGGVLFLVGESGVGKSRLAAAAAKRGFAADMRLLRGRASALDPMVPFRSLTEAMLSLVRLGEPIDVAALGPYRPILARLIPDWGEPPGEQEGASLVILAEAVLRLTALAGRDRGCVVTLDDLHNADPETLAVVEYLIDNLDDQPTLLVCSVGDETPSPALRMARSASQRRNCTVFDLGPLDRADLPRMAASFLGVRPDRVPDPVVDLVWAGSDGNPFQVEELLGGMLDSGVLVQDGDGCALTARLEKNLPVTFVRSVNRRMDLLDPEQRQVLSVAATLGRRFPLAVVRRVVGLDYRDLLSHLHGDAVAQLVGQDEQTPDWYAFRHSLITEALLAAFTPAQRANLAGRVADAVESIYPGLPGEWCQVSAALRLDAGQQARAGHLFAEAGTRALALGAAHTALALLDKAADLLTDPAARADVLEARLDALAEAGLIDRALATAEVLDQVGGQIDHRRRARLHARLAWVANLDGRTMDGLDQVEIARALLGPDAAPADVAPLDVVAAHLRLELPGLGRLAEAETMARRAAEIAEQVPLPVVACQAWQLLGALVRARDAKEAAHCLERSRSIAVRHDLPIWEIHALVRLGLNDALQDGGVERLEQARQKASRIGAVTARYQAEVNIALQLVLRGDFAAAESVIDQVLAATTRLKLMEITQFMLLNRAVLAAHRGRRRDMDRALAELGKWDVEPDQHVPRVHGLAKAFCALLEENRVQARDELRVALDAETRNPTTFRLSGRDGLHLLLTALDGELALSDLRGASGQLRWDRQFALFAEAVLAGRDGRVEEAATLVADAVQVGEPYAMGRHLGLRLVAEAALADGWGTPLEWLRAAESYFHDADIATVAGACRALLRRSGQRVTQRRAGVADIPAGMRAAGITAREYQVLRLLVDRLGNQEIANILHLSLRTVEKHVSSLMSKTGQPNRIALGKFAATAD
ncbi:ATP-binding protein [Actinokineospora sp. HUAS TT18]|uniref:ATP-binding protein n=1 Tax=Actinokineospora sp. HUAS TT18 TaxID=3447451 RepID=UPI003F51EC7B